MLHRMPRIDVLRAFHPGLSETSPPDTDTDSADDPYIRSYRSGFWGIARIAPRDCQGDFTLLESRPMTRVSTGNAKLDEMLGGGLLPGTALEGGKPRCAKTTQVWLAAKCATCCHQER